MTISNRPKQRPYSLFLYYFFFNNICSLKAASAHRVNSGTLQWHRVQGWSTLIRIRPIPFLINLQTQHLKCQWLCRRTISWLLVEADVSFRKQAEVQKGLFPSAWRLTLSSQLLSSFFSRSFPDCESRYYRKILQPSLCIRAFWHFIV